MSPRAQLLHATLAAGTLTTLHALYQGSRHPTPLALSASVNGGIAGAIFFSIREVLVGPALRSAVPSARHAQESSNVSPQSSWAHLRMRQLPDSTVSGALTGAILNAWQHGRSRLWAGARTGGIICAVLQWGHNEMGIMRVKFVSRKIQESRSPSAPSPAPTSPPDDPTKPRITVFDRLVSVIGFRKLSDEEYLKAVKKQRDEALARIAVLEQERKEREQHHSGEADSS
ncbi:hypothetical protein C8Q80DRAFT_748250 [Daedaleopsis nitida]|nr:hypothetical protein C8Q80DRAFT_748250 [Daedaleopsis nitida]